MPAELELTPEEILADDPEEPLDAPVTAMVIRYKWLRWLLERWGTEEPGARIARVQELAARRGSLGTTPEE